LQQLTLERQQLVVEMRDKLRFTELQLAGAREEGSRLANTIEDQRARLADVETELAGERERQRQQEPAIRELHRKVQAAENEKHAVLEELQQEQWRVERVSAAKEQTIALQEQRLAALQAELRQAREGQHSGQSAEARLADQTRVNAELTQQLMLHKEQLRTLHSARRSEAHLQAVLQQLHLDNARLLKLLASTEEYRGFTQHAQDAGGTVYVPHLPPQRGGGGGGGGGGAEAAGGGGARPTVLRPPEEVELKANARAVRGAKREADYWVPADAYAVADEFRHAHVPGVPLETFAALLVRLNRVWKARETTALEPTP